MRYRDAEFEKVEVTRDVPFAKVRNFNNEDETLKLDIYRPEADTDNAPRVLLFVHGGGFRTGNDKSQRYITALCEIFAKRGYVCAACDYRVREKDAPIEGAADDAAEDLRRAIEYLRANAAQLKIDADRLGAIGGSAGGMALARLLLYGGASDSGVRALGILWGAPSEKFISASEPDGLCKPPPTIIFHGDRDALVPFEAAQALDAYLTSNGFEHTFVPLKGAGHTCMDYGEGIVGMLSLYLLWHLD